MTSWLPQDSVGVPFVTDSVSVIHFLNGVTSVWIFFTSVKTSFISKEMFLFRFSQKRRHTDVCWINRAGTDCLQSGAICNWNGMFQGDVREAFKTVYQTFETSENWKANMRIKCFFAFVPSRLGSTCHRRTWLPYWKSLRVLEIFSPFSNEQQQRVDRKWRDRGGIHQRSPAGLKQRTFWSRGQHLKPLVKVTATYEVFVRDKNAHAFQEWTVNPHF